MAHHGSIINGEAGHCPCITLRDSHIGTFPEDGGRHKLTQRLQGIEEATIVSGDNGNGISGDGELVSVRFTDCCFVGDQSELSGLWVFRSNDRQANAGNTLQILRQTLSERRNRNALSSSFRSSYRCRGHGDGGERVQVELALAHDQRRGIRHNIDLSAFDNHIL